MTHFTKKNVVITGATRGIGFAIASLFVQKGANVTVIGRNKERVLDASNKLEKGLVSDQRVEGKVLDVANFSDVLEFAEEYLKEHQTIDVLINCAGVTKDNLFIRQDEDAWDEVMNTNAKSVFNFSKAFVRSMIKKRSGSIINISSVIGAVVGNPGQTNYAASKAAMKGFTQSLAKEVAARGITVNCIAPGFIATDMTENLMNKEAILETIPMKKMGTPDDIAKAALFLASEDANYITGQTIVVDGGMTS